MKENKSQSVSSSLAQVDTKVRNCYGTQIRTFACADELFYRPLIANHDTKNILDVGCGEGSFILNLAKKFPNTNFQGVEILPNLVTACIEQQNKLGIHNIKFHQALFDEHFPHSNFDIITARFSVEHMKNIPAFLQ